MPPRSASASPPAALTALSMGAKASELPTELIQAYRNAWYEVALPARATVCTLQVDVHSPALRSAMQQLGVCHAGLLTACNPWGAILSPMDNEQRMRALRAALQQDGWSWAPAFGRDPASQWPGEDSLLVWHMDAASACSWGQRWEQNAVLTIARDAIPRLALLR